MAQEMPPMELSSEMVMGISAPPTRKVKTTPKSAPVANMMPIISQGKNCEAML